MNNNINPIETLMGYENSDEMINNLKDMLLARINDVAFEKMENYEDDEIDC